MAAVTVEYQAVVELLGPVEHGQTIDYEQFRQAWPALTANEKQLVQAELNARQLDKLRSIEKAVRFLERRQDTASGLPSDTPAPQSVFQLGKGAYLIRESASQFPR